MVHKENQAGRAITKLLDWLPLDNEQAKLFVRAVSREEHMANGARTRYDIAMQYCSGAIPKAKVVIATTGLVWEQKAHMHSALKVQTFWWGRKPSKTWTSSPLSSGAIPRQPFLRLLFGDPKQSPGGVADDLREHRGLLLKALMGLPAAHRW